MPSINTPFTIRRGITMGNRITGLFQPLIDAVDRTVASAAEALVRNAGEGNGQKPEERPLSQKAEHPNHKDSMRAFLDRKWHTDTRRKRVPADKKRKRQNNNRVCGRPHG